MRQLLKRVLRRLTSAGALEQLSADIKRQRDISETHGVLAAQALSGSVAALPPDAPLEHAEFRVFSQFGEDGIIQFLLAHTRIEAHERAFVEFGVESYTEANTRLLVLKDYWRGLVMDGSAANVASIRNSSLYWRHDLTAVNAWIDRDNINDLIRAAGFAGDIGLLSIDVDGNDYWILEALCVVRPVILVCEWNAIFGAERAVTVPYVADFHRTRAHYSNLYWGASIAALQRLARTKGYELVGSNRAGNNLFFVRRDRLGALPVRSVHECYRAACFREARASDGSLTFESATGSRHLIAELPLVDVESGRLTCLRELSETSQRDGV